MMGCNLKILVTLLAQDETVQEITSQLEEARDSGSNKLIVILLIIIGVIAALFVLLMVIKCINTIIWKKRNKLRKKMIALENDDAIKTVAVNVLRNDGDRIEAAASQILGTRSNQQDSYYISADAVSFDLLNTSYIAATVCDGMGGLSSGEAASRLTVECIEESFQNFIKSNGTVNIPDMLRETALKANDAVCRYSVEKCDGKMCGTTMVFALLENNNLYWISAGDSRIYVIRNKQIVQITNDHNYAYTLEQRVKQGVMSREEALRSANREALISYIGISELDMIDLSVNPFKLIKGDVVLLCSDGLTKIMSDAQICDLVNQYKDDTKELAELLPLTAADMCVGSQDNTTVAVICYK